MSIYLAEFILYIEIGKKKVDNITKKFKQKREKDNFFSFLRFFKQLFRISSTLFYWLVYLIKTNKKNNFFNLKQNVKIEKKINVFFIFLVEL